MSREAGKTEKDGKEKKLQYRILFDKSGDIWPVLSLSLNSFYEVVD